ncbi:MAG: C4-dicarboxylate ABC transporter substrate-binding protein [Marinomonas sp.]|jgi:tripartite ATP-independent transporter DctP family solute receptor|uniref:Tripartite ATP-independent transporter DctP family solute receptor n=1 Tax=Marinomonas communis TaxID=28254 RepID=A0A4R6XCN5_9GAMM|nr:DctP family TRAP transporter solute-binding subunit [Marinomonas communis]MAF17480.1 C4-dicarboxylate ABC transporter substrate-binding protein [Marinomonas sp.]MEC8082007.1 DctP family TRAP transporter solute-binding subunit [Pseudomonadota bacterium]MCC4275395.1 DctP family TRAP transporter solute-binding subunit [Marinomonas communis]RUM53809.1 MAG: C4-dicarboxylate ABC transporter substrate-binding protein [Marinomonas sp.]TDR15450.1 tripartite ATP-independent transporter DctP family so
MKFAKKLMLGLATAGMASVASAADITLTIGHVDPQEWTSSKKGAATEVFKNLVEAESGGRIEVNVYPSGQLGGETDLVQSAQEGMISMTMVSGAFAKVCKEASVLEIPYLFPSAPVAWEVLDGEFGKALSEHCLEQTGLRTLAYGETGFRNFTNSKRPVAEPADLEGLKIRVMTLPLYVEMVKAMGAEPTPIAWPEVPSALTTGVVDGQENPVSVIDANKFYEFQKYLTLDGHVYGTDFFLINEDIYQSLDQADQEIVARAAKVAGTLGRAIQQFNSAKGLKSLAENGMEITTPTSEQLAKFQAAAQPAVIEWLKGEVDSQWIDHVQASVKAVKSN